MTTANRLEQIEQVLRKTRGEVEQLFPIQMTFDRHLEGMIQALRKNPKLMECTSESLVAVFKEAAYLGLDLHPALEYLALIPRGKRAELQRGYRGAMELALRSGKLKRFEAHAVFKRDLFAVDLGTSPNLRHMPRLDEPRGEFLAAYVIVQYSSSGIEIEVMTREDIEKVRRKSSSPDSNAWTKDFPRMAVKTVILRKFNTLPRSCFDRSGEGPIVDLGEKFEEEQLETLLDNDGTLTEPPEEKEPPEPPKEREPLSEGKPSLSREGEPVLSPRQQIIGEIRAEYRRLGVEGKGQANARRLIICYVLGKLEADPKGWSIEELKKFLGKLKSWDRAAWDTEYIKAQDWRDEVPF